MGNPCFQSIHDGFLDLLFLGRELVLGRSGLHRLLCNNGRLYLFNLDRKRGNLVPFPCDNLRVSGFLRSKRILFTHIHLTLKLCDKQICQAGICLIDNKVSRIFWTYFRTGCPRLVFLGDPAIMGFLLDGVGKHILNPFRGELLQNTCDRSFGSKAVICVVVADCIFNGLFTGHICIIGSMVNIQLIRFKSVACSLTVDGNPFISWRILCLALNLCFLLGK